MCKTNCPVFQLCESKIVRNLTFKRFREIVLSFQEETTFTKLQVKRNRRALPRVIIMLVIIEWFSIECRKTKTRVITLANHKDTDNQVKRSKHELHVADPKRGKTRTSESRLVLVVNAKPITFRHSNENRSKAAFSIIELVWTGT